MSEPERIIKLARVWEDDGAPWLVVFELTRVKGRLECVGMSMRSYVRRMVVEKLPDEEGGTQVYESFGDGPMTPEELWTELSDPGAQVSAFDVLVDEFVTAQQSFSGDEPPRPLSTVILRQLPFFSVLTRARLEEAKSWRVPEGSVGLLKDSADAFNAMAESLEKPRAAQGRRARGRPRKYTDDTLARVAEIYNDAVENRGSHTPTKDVREALNIPQRAAEKLVAKCRHELHTIPTPHNEEGPSR